MNSPPPLQVWAEFCGVGGWLWNLCLSGFFWLAGGFEWALCVWKTEITVWLAQITTQAGAGPGWAPAATLMCCLMNLVLFSLRKINPTVVSTVIILWNQLMDLFCFVPSVVLVASWGLCSLAGWAECWSCSVQNWWVLFQLELDWWFCWSHFRSA